VLFLAITQGPHHHIRFVDSDETTLTGAATSFVGFHAWFTQEFGLKIAPAEFDRENWETPRKIVADLESRMRVNV
jgi:hypothetical protein